MTPAPGAPHSPLDARSCANRRLLQEFLSLGYHLLLSDVDILTLKVRWGAPACCDLHRGESHQGSHTSVRVAPLCHTPQDPFKKLHRDSDIEAMSDGFDENTAYGANEPEAPAARWAPRAAETTAAKRWGALFGGTGVRCCWCVALLVSRLGRRV